MKSNEIEELRERIDSTDAAIVDLILERTALAHKIGEVKQVKGLPVYRPDRHTQVYRKVLAHLDALSSKLGDLSGNSVLRRGLVSVHREIMSLGMAVEGRLNVFGCGAEAAAAASLCFGRSISIQTLETGQIRSVPRESYLVVAAIPRDLAAASQASFQICAAIQTERGEAPGFYIFAASTAERTGEDRTVFLIEKISEHVPEQGAPGETLFTDGVLFVLDVPGHSQDSQVHKRETTMRAKFKTQILGSYPALVKV